MRRGQERREHGPGWTKAELVAAAGISASTFDMIRKAARVSGPSHGGMGFVFDREALSRLVARARSGTFSERGRPAAEAWQALLDEGPGGADGA